MGELTIGAIIFMVIVWVLVLSTVVISLKKITAHDKKKTNGTVDKDHDIK